MKLKLFMPTTSIAGGLFMLKRTKKHRRHGYDDADPDRKNKCAATVETTLADLMAIVIEEEAKR